MFKFHKLYTVNFSCHFFSSEREFSIINVMVSVWNRGSFLYVSLLKRSVLFSHKYTAAVVDVYKYADTALRF